MTAHPFHQHGGWYNVIGMGQYNISEIKITREFIKDQDKNCSNGQYCLPRNFTLAPFKDTIQVPLNGYVIFRTPVNNKGVWIFHCHINFHVEAGMAMAFQIGGLDEPLFNVTVTNPPITVASLNQSWNLGPLKDNVNKICQPERTNTINWFLGMQPAYICANPGEQITFIWP